MSLDVSLVMPVYNERYLVAESIRRVLAVRSDRIRSLELIVVDDGSTDGSREILRELAGRHPDRITYLEHDRNRGKGAAVRSGLTKVRGAVTVIQDADLEYDPRDIERLLVPFLQEEADVVYGSRFLTHEYRRVLYYRHALGNRLITTICNIFTDLNLTDVETCYKAVRSNLLRSIPIRSSDFRLEVELTFKLAKRGARIFEVPISYSGRSYAEGKKIGFRDGILALGSALHWWLVDDIYDPEQYGSNILVALSETPHFNRWMGARLAPYLGNRVLEIGAGIGNLTRLMIPRDRYTASDVNAHYLEYLQAVAESKPYMDVARLDLGSAEDFRSMTERYDTVVCVNVLEHVDDEAQAIRNLRSVLEPGGRAVVLVPQGPSLFGTLDEALGHERRYTRESLRVGLEAQGLAVEELFDFNRATLPGWWLNGKILKRRHFGRLQLKALDWMIWLIRRIDGVLPWSGTSIVAVARRTDA